MPYIAWQLQSTAFHAGNASMSGQAIYTKASASRRVYINQYIEVPLMVAKGSGASVGTCDHPMRGAWGRTKMRLHAAAPVA